MSERTAASGPNEGDVPPLDGRYVYAECDAKTARDGIALTTQTAYMRRMGEAGGWKPALILVVVDEGHLAEAGERVRAALNGDAGPERRVDSAA